MNPTIPASVRQGKLLWADPRRLAEVLRRFNGKDVHVVIKEHRHPRSISQNSYYWGCVLEIISEHTGHTADEVHEIFKNKYLAEEKEFAGEKVRVARSTAGLNTKEFTEYLEKIKDFSAQEFEIYVPNANEVAI